MHIPFKPLIFIVILQVLLQRSLQQCEVSNDFNENYFDKEDKTLIAEKKLGKGSFGRVELVRWSGVAKNEVERMVAVKSALKKEHNELLLNELRIMKKAELKKSPEEELINEPNEVVLEGWQNPKDSNKRQSHIPEFIGCFIGPDNMNYLVIQYIPKPIDPDYRHNIYGIVDGRNKNYLKFVRLPPAQRREIYAQIADGLSQLHDKGITHGDIKPENLLFDTDKEDNWTAYIIDFGGAVDTKVRPRFVTDPYFDMTLFDHHKKYSIWDKIKKEKDQYHYGPQLDVYALAVTIFALEKSYKKDPIGLIVSSPSNLFTDENKDINSAILKTVEIISKVNSITSDTQNWLDKSRADWLTGLTEDWLISLLNDKPKDLDNGCCLRAANELRDLFLNLMSEARNR